MRKLIKLTALFTLLLLFYGTAFGGGWQKILYNYGFTTAEYDKNLDFIPTSDGGILVQGLEDQINVPNYDGHFLAKFDQFGNIHWKKSIHKLRFDSVFVGYTVAQYIESILEIDNNRYVVVHTGPYIDSSGVITNHTNLRYFTIIDNYGNILSAKYNLSDSVSNAYVYKFFYDTTSGHYKLLTTIWQSGKNYLIENTYDASFNLLNKKKKEISTTNQENILYVTNDLLIMSNAGSKSINQFSIYDRIGNLKNKKYIRGDSINFYVLDTLKKIYPTCNIGFSSIAAEYEMSDSYVDNNSNLHLFQVKFYNTSGVDSTCDRPQLYCLVEMIFNLQNYSTKYKINLLDFPIERTIQYQAYIYPKTDGSLNIMAFDQSAIFSIDAYNILNYNLLNNKINSSRKYSNLGEFSREWIHIGSYKTVPTKKSKLDNSFYTIYSNNANSVYLIKMDTNGNINNQIIQGNVFADQNNNCIKNTTDNSLPQVTVTAQNNNNTAFTSSDNNGNYFIGVSDSGLYTVTAQPNINYPLFVQGNCAVQTSYAYLDSFTIDTINLNLKPTILCPNMYVDISTPMLRRCVSNIYTVNYKNNGTIASPNTFIDVALDRFLTVNSASIPYTNLGNNVLRFNIGNVDYMSSGRFTIDVTVRCDSTIVGQTHCVEAHIYPDTVCAAANYTGPVISASAQCKHDSVEFKLRNSGGNMQNPKRYIVIEDNLNRLNGNYQLNNGQQKIVTIAADSGHTYGIIAEQDDAFPIQLGDKFATAFIEGCNPINGQFNTGFITQYPEFDGEPYRSVDCQQNRGAFDPNDKTGFPIGVSGQHYIEKNTAIDYKINFQNTGNDTAFKVVIVDTISKYLDINTIEPGASSHRYTYMRTDSNTIKFIFDSIKLVDSNKNEKLSHGFVKFRIQQKQNNPNGTKIYNQAEIYFDYNAPIFTNKTMHTIGDVYVRIISKTINPTYSKADVKIYPNPFRENVTIELQNMELQTTHLILLDIAGNEILQMQSINNKYLLNGSNLAKGLYLFRIQNDKTEIANGKLIVQ